MLGNMAPVLALGLAIGVAGIVMDAPAVRLFVMRQVTSRPLGSLAPGYAATVRGYHVYSGLVRAFGLVLVGVWLAALIPWGALIAVIGVAFFAYNSVKAIRGEVQAYRSLKR